MTEQTILDMCCGSRMFWFDKQDPRALFADIRSEQHTLCDGRSLVISPDIIADFRALPFADASFPIVVFDPPHLERVGENAWMGKKYGRLNKDTWRDDLCAGFEEAFRVLRPHGVLIFKWNETQIPVSQILALITKIKNQLRNFDTVVLKDDEALALVEALERKEEQRANWFQMAQKLGEDLDAAEKRNTELEEQNEYNRKRYQQLDLLIGKNILVM